MHAKRFVSAVADAMLLDGFDLLEAVFYSNSCLFSLTLFMRFQAVHFALKRQKRVTETQLLKCSKTRCDELPTQEGHAPTEKSHSVCYNFF